MYSSEDDLKLIVEDAIEIQEHLRKRIDVLNFTDLMIKHDLGFLLNNFCLYVGKSPGWESRVFTFMQTVLHDTKTPFKFDDKPIKDEWRAFNKQTRWQLIMAVIIASDYNFLSPLAVANIIQLMLFHYSGRQSGLELARTIYVSLSEQHYYRDRLARSVMEQLTLLQTIKGDLREVLPYDICMVGHTYLRSNNNDHKLPVKVPVYQTLPDEFKRAVSQGYSMALQRAGSITDVPAACFKRLIIAVDAYRHQLEETFITSIEKV